MAATTIAAAAAKMGKVSGLIQVLQVLKETGVITGIFSWLGNKGDKKRNAAIVLRYGQKLRTK